MTEGVYLPSWLTSDRSVAPLGKLIYARLLALAGPHKSVRIEQCDLADFYGVSLRTVYHHMGELRNAGYVDKDTTDYAMRHKYFLLKRD